MPAAAGTTSAASSPGAIVAAVDGSATADRIADASARLALRTGRPVHLLHVQESAVAAGEASETEDLTAARDTVHRHLDALAAHGVTAQGHLLLHADDHAAAGRMIAEYAARVAARVIVIGPPSHQGLAALVAGSVTQELWRHAHCHVLVVNPTLAPPNDVLPDDLQPDGTAARATA